MITLIPIAHESLIAQFIAVWSMSSPSAYVVSRGVYRKSTITVEIENSFTTIPNQEGNLILSNYSYLDFMRNDDEIYKMSVEYILILGALPNDVRTYCEQLTPSCIFFDTDEDTLKYMNNNELY